MDRRAADFRARHTVGSRLRLGKKELEVAAVLTLEPERSANFFNLAPRLIMNADDVAATGLVQTGSRVSYYLYAAGTPQEMKALENRLRPQLERGQRIDDLESGRPEVRASIERAQRFLGLTALLAAVLAGVAIALGTRRFVERHLDGCAVMRCFGATQGQLMRLYGLEFLLLGIGRCTVGALLGYVASRPSAPRSPTCCARIFPCQGRSRRCKASSSGSSCCWASPCRRSCSLRTCPRCASSAASPGRRRRWRSRLCRGARRARRIAHLAGGRREARRLRGGGFAVAGARLRRDFLGTAAPDHPSLGNPAGRQCHDPLRLVQLRRHAAGNAVQTASLALGLAAVLLLTFTHNDLVQAWRRSAPADAPNRFLMACSRGRTRRSRPSSPGAASRRRSFPDGARRVTALNGKAVSEKTTPRSVQGASSSGNSTSPT